MSVAAIYEGWPKVQNHLVARLPNLTPEQLALKASPDGWPVWALISHLAGARVYWLCHIFKEPGADKTPFADPSGDGWEDHLDHPRR
ncbi:MAG: DinB family protein, partial [Chloroflexi bacterium]